MQPWEILRRFINNLGGFPGKQLPAFMVASMGRSGSGMLFEALVIGVLKKRFGPRAPKLRQLIPWKMWDLILTSEAWDLSATKLVGGVVYKTHDFPDDYKSKWPTKTIYIFGPASDAAVSVYLCMENFGREWMDKHFKHLRADGPFEEIFERDILRFEEQINSWSMVPGLNVLAVRYETLWDNVDILSDFVGFPVLLPLKRERQAKTADPEIIRRAQALYGELDTRIAALPDVFRPPLLDV